MRSWILVAGCLLSGCTFTVTGLDVDQSIVVDDLSAGQDFAVNQDLSLADLAGPDLATNVDLAGADLLGSPDMRMRADMRLPNDMLALPPDLTPVDPCGPSLPVPANAIAAHCSIGDTITIDGTLTDWSGAFFTNTDTQANAAASANTMGWSMSDATNDKNISANFAVRWDTTALYVAAHIMDDAAVTFTSPNNDEIWKGDSIEVYIRSATTGGAYTSNDGQYVFDSADNSRVFRTSVNVGDVPAGVSFAAVAAVAAGPATANWNFELKIPWAVIGGSGTVGRIMGLDISLNDCDAAGSCRARYLTWKKNPTAAMCPGCPAGSCVPQCNTSTFEDLQLGSR